MNHFSDGHALQRLKKILKIGLISLGVIFLFLIVIFIFVFKSSSDFLDNNQEFIFEFVEDLSHNWSPDDVYARLTNEFIGTLDNSATTTYFRDMKLLGSLVAATDFTMGNYSVSSGTTTAVVSFKASFENGAGLITITAIKKEGKVLVHAFRFQQVGQLAAPADTKA